MEQIVQSVTLALVEAFNVAWEVLWPLILGFALSGAVQAVVSHRSMSRLLGGNSPRGLTFATLFGIASSSCSYVAVALARSIFPQRRQLHRRKSCSSWRRDRKS